MKAITNNDKATFQIPKGGEVPVTEHLRNTMAALHPQEMKDLFQFLRLDLHSRMLGLDDRGLIQLQGKLDYSNELEQFFLSLLK